MNFFLALLTNKTVVAWGANNCNQTNVPTGIANVESIAAGGGHALALISNGTVLALGSNGSGETNTPTGLSNVISVVAGNRHSVALKNDGAVVSWGEILDIQTNMTPRFISAGDGFTLETQFSPLIQYPVDVSKDVLIVYNSSPTYNNSLILKDYYLANRPMMGNANVLGIVCNTNWDTIHPDDFTNIIAAPFFQWLADHLAKHPSYVIILNELPARVNTNTWWTASGCHPSVSVSLYDMYAGWKPFITHINAGTVDDCKAYVDKLATFGATYSPGKLIISASASPLGYGNTRPRKKLSVKL